MESSKDIEFLFFLFVELQYFFLYNLKNTVYR